VNLSDLADSPLRDSAFLFASAAAEFASGWAFLFSGAEAGIA
jgi:hypothetical protein